MPGTKSGAPQAAGSDRGSLLANAANFILCQLAASRAGLLIVENAQNYLEIIIDWQINSEASGKIA